MAASVQSARLLVSDAGRDHTKVGRAAGRGADGPKTSRLWTSARGRLRHGQCDIMMSSADSQNKMITEAEIEQFDRDGAVTFNGPFTECHIKTLGHIFDRVDKWDDYSRFEPEFLEVFQHPFCE